MRKLIRKILREGELDFIKDHYSLDGIRFTANRYWPSHYRSPSIIYTITDEAVEASYLHSMYSYKEIGEWGVGDPHHHVDNLVLVSWGTDQQLQPYSNELDAGETFIMKETVMENFRNGWWEIYEG